MRIFNPESVTPKRSRHHLVGQSLLIELSPSLRSMKMLRVGTGLLHPLRRSLGRLRFATTAGKNRGFVLGIMRESYNLWERRAPLCPSHVKSLIDKYQTSPSNSRIFSNVQGGGGSGDVVPELTKIIVQPSNLRIFSNKQYEEAGAVVQEELDEADLILGVKRPLNEADLIPKKAYAFFSHVVKGQPENMDLLKYVLDNNIQLFDYECIVAGGMHSTSQSMDQKQERVVAFGKFAGLAGVNDALHALGRRLLHRGYSTPFLHVPPAYIYSDWEEAKRTLGQVGDDIDKDGLDMEALVFCITGRGGKVHSGAMEVIKELPHKLVTVEELPTIVARQGPHQCIYVLQVGASDLFVPTNGQPFDRSRYKSHPDEFSSVFRDRIAPYTSVLVNTAYWDERFPRLLSKQAMRDLYASETPPPLQVVADISCDINGSIEFLHRTTSIERPFYEYDPHSDREITDEITGDGVTVLGVDILPSELPKESSDFFGDALLPFVSSVIEGANAPCDRNASRVGSLPPELGNACITASGELTKRFTYLKALLARQPKRAKNYRDFMLLTLEGHLFDSGMVNQSLDIIERQNCHYEIVECNVRKNDDGSPRKSLVVLKVAAPESVTLDTIHSKISTLSDVVDAADATVKRSSAEGGMKTPLAYVQSEEPKKVLVLGSGLVANSAVEYLGRNAAREIVVGGNDETEVRTVARCAANGTHELVDISNGADNVSRLIDEAELVVSLLPASFHPVVAEMCIDRGTNLVTASYESDDMRRLKQRAQNAGISILNEVGLDPGLDHMSAMRIIDDIHDRGGTVSRFESHCGGLPAPSAADNPLRYKFSWNPKGVLTACLNDARYMMDGTIVEVDGEHLLSSKVQGFRSSWSDLDLECLPNRDSLTYMEKYGIQSARTCLRGTLRYEGFSAMMDVYRSLGFFYDGPMAFDTWGEVYEKLCGTDLTGSGRDAMLLAAAKGNHHLVQKFVECKDFLGLDESQPLENPESVLDSFAKVLEEKLSFRPNESDMVLMQHKIVGVFDGDEATELHSSTLQLFGDERASAMSKTVGYTTAIAAEMMLTGEISSGRGLLLPTNKEIYGPVLDRIGQEQVVFSEHGVRLDSTTKRSAAMIVS